MQILVVDDSKTIRFMLIKLLNEIGYDQIAQAVDVDDALYQIQLKMPDLIFSDYNMPGKTGLDFLKLVRQHPKASQVPFIMVTTMHDKKIIFDSVKAGLQYYILKPVEKNILIEKLTSLAQTYNFQPPRKAVLTRPATAPAPSPVGDEKAMGDIVVVPEQSNGFSPELCEAIAEHFFLVFDGELTMQDFLGWATENVLPKGPQGGKIQSAQHLLDLLRVSANDGIRAGLNL